MYVSQTAKLRIYFQQSCIKLELALFNSQNYVSEKTRIFYKAFSCSLVFFIYCIVAVVCSAVCSHRNKGYPRKILIKKKRICLLMKEHALQPESRHYLLLLPIQTSAAVCVFTVDFHTRFGSLDSHACTNRNYG